MSGQEKLLAATKKIAAARRAELTLLVTGTRRASASVSAVAVTFRKFAGRKSARHPSADFD